MPKGMHLNPMFVHLWLRMMADLVNGDRIIQSGERKWNLAVLLLGNENWCGNEQKEEEEEEGRKWE